jgi:hypothetical protein
VTLFFSRLGKFSAIIVLNRLSVPLVYISFPFTPMIHRFGLFMVPQISCMFHSYFLSIFSWSFTIWSNSSTLSSVPDTLFSVHQAFDCDIYLWYWIVYFWLFFRVSTSLLISSVISWIVFLILFICLYFLWAHLIVYSHSLWGLILTFVFLLCGCLSFLLFF